jgi:hypothetical protein
VTVTTTELAQDERGNYRFLGAATLGEGTKKVLGVSTDKAKARHEAERKAKRAEQILAAVEVHGPDDLPELDGYRTLRSPSGELVEAPETTVPHLVAAGYTEVDMTKQVTQPMSTQTAPAQAPKRRGRPPKNREQPVDVPPVSAEDDE